MSEQHGTEEGSGPVSSAFKKGGATQKRRALRKNATCLVDLSKLIKSVRLDTRLRAQLSKSSREVARIANRFQDVRKELDSIVKELEAQDRMGNFEIQRLMSAFNQAETMASQIVKTRDDTANAIVGRIV